jgi:hypothetical protein
MGINSALATLSPVQPDYIKNQTSSAIYYAGYGWFGTLSNLLPRDGYMIRLTNPGTLVYPITGLKSAVAEVRNDIPSIEPAGYEFNGSLTASVLSEGVLIGHDDDLLFAYVDDQVRGVVEARYFEPTGTWLFPLMIHSNVETGEIIRFKFFNSAENRLYNCDDTIHFNNDMVIADALKSLRLNLTPEINDLQESNDDQFQIKIYPNPFTQELNFHYRIMQQSRVRLFIYDTYGRLINQIINEVQTAGAKDIKWIPEGLSEGVYIVHLDVEGRQTVRKVTLIK